MAEQNLGPRDFFAKEDAIADLGLIACPGAEELCKLVDSHLVRWAREVGNDAVDTFIIPCDCPRFQSGDAKGLVKASTRGDDLYIFVDPGNYSVTYKLFGYENHLSPDDHFQNLMRIIQAVSGRAHRISVIMPSLYGGRQHRRVSRESLDCAFSLQQLRAVGCDRPRRGGLPVLHDPCCHGTGESPGGGERRGGWRALHYRRDDRRPLHRDVRRDNALPAQRHAV